MRCRLVLTDVCICCTGTKQVQEKRSVKETEVESETEVGIETETDTERGTEIDGTEIAWTGTGEEAEVAREGPVTSTNTMMTGL